jgi:GNAT superfamily N-acetyltransferase
MGDILPDVNGDAEGATDRAFNSPVSRRQDGRHVVVSPDDTRGPARCVERAGARRHDELLRFGTALETWGSGLAAWLHDALIATYPSDLRRLSLRVFEQNDRARRFYERLGWTTTVRTIRSGFAPHPVLVELVLDRSDQP